MGRKPNALLTEFFERGQKIGDQSNRYQHTCKRCGLIFPKGRPDALLRHLFEKCPQITNEDRQRAFVNRLEQDAVANNYSLQNGFRLHDDVDVLDHGDIQMSSLLQREPSALDTLAEVSRQHLDLTRQRTEAAQYGEPVEEPSNDLDGLYAQLRATLAHGQQMDELASGQGDGEMDQHISAGSPLVEAASAANELQAILSEHPVQGAATADVQDMAQEGLRSVSQQEHHNGSSHLDPQLQTDHLAASSAELSTATTTIAGTNSAYPSSQYFGQPRQAGTGPSTLQYPGPSGGYGLLQKPLKGKRRSKFNNDRRQEVKSVRKMGACIRCRMLKKPCSGETPCATCRTIESARLWKNSCIRTRVADEFTLWSTTFFHAQAHAKVHSVLHGMTLDKVKGRIVAALFPETGSYVAFEAMASKAARSDEIGLDPVLDRPAKGKDAREICMIDYESDEVTGKLERYLLESTVHFIEQETLFLQVTLRTADELIGRDGDVLLAKVVNLWTGTNVLSRSNESRWTFSYAPDPSSVEEPEQIQQDFTDSIVGGHAFATHSPDYDIIKAQIMDAVERYCAKQSKAVMNELERRLLARQQSSSFTTFLVSVILLNCVERMSYLFRSFDIRLGPASHPEKLQSEPQSVEKATERIIGAADPDQVQHEALTLAGVPSNWPLEYPPSHYWPQGASFANLLTLLLRMRGLPPTTIVKPDGGLAIMANDKSYAYEVLPDTNSEIHANVDPQLVLAAQWIEKTGVRVEELIQSRDVGDDFKTSSERQEQGWDLRFIASLILPA